MFKAISYTHLHLLACPYAAFLRYEGAIKGPITHHLALGNGVHYALEKIYTQPTGVQSLEKAIEYFDQEFQKQLDDEKFFGSYPQIVKSRKEGYEMLERYYVQMESGRISKTPLAVEKEFRLPIVDDVEIVGKIDKVEETDEGIVVTDYKSGSRKPDDWMLRRNLQFTTYFWACKELYGEYPVKVQWHHLRTGEILASTRDDFDIDQLVRIVKAAVFFQRQDLRYRVYHDVICNMCDYKGETCDDPNLEQEILSVRQQ